MKTLTTVGILPICIRCGFCCVCEPSYPDEDALCIFLVINKESTSCELVTNPNLDSSNMRVGKGCDFRVETSHLYERYKRHKEPILSFIEYVKSKIEHEIMFADAVKKYDKNNKVMKIIKRYSHKYKVAEMTPFGVRERYK